MNALLSFHTLCASRGDGLLPEFVALLQRPPELVRAELEFAEVIRLHAESREEIPPAPRLGASPP
ncbi:hypothetical protein [Mesorhizobium sp. A623]